LDRLVDKRERFDPACANYCKGTQKSIALWRLFAALARIGCDR
jgi:hypothetical protein